MRALTLAVVIAAAATAAACGGSSSASSAIDQPTTTAASAPAATPTPVSSPAGAPPVVTESFTALPCRPGTTLGMEGCAERRVLHADSAVNDRVQALWAGASATARADLAKAQNAWQQYRAAACTSESAAYAGGSLAAVTYAQCAARLTVQRAAELARQASLTP